MDIARQERLNLRLVKEVEKHPCLYKTDSVEYSRRGITDKAWAEVGRVVGWPAAKCKDKFKNIRAVVSRYKKLMNTGVRKRPYYLMEHMRYTFPYIKAFKEKPSDRQSAHRHDVCDNPLHYDETGYEGFEFQGEVKLETSSKGSHSPDKNSAHQYFDNSPSPSIEAFRESPSPSPSSPGASFTKNDSTRRLVQPKDTSNQAEQNTDQSTIHNDSSNGLQNDHKKMFLLSLLPDVYAMNDAQTRKFKRGVLQLVDDILIDA